MWLFDSLLSLATEGHRKKCKQRVKLFAAHRSAFRKYLQATRHQFGATTCQGCSAPYAEQYWLYQVRSPLRKQFRRS